MDILVASIILWVGCINWFVLTQIRNELKYMNRDK